jgi:hypothetical protein
LTWCRHDPWICCAGVHRHSKQPVPVPGGMQSGLFNGHTSIGSIQHEVCLLVISMFPRLCMPSQFCIMEQMHVYGQRLPGEPMLVGMFQVRTICSTCSCKYVCPEVHCPQWRLLSLALPASLDTNLCIDAQAANVLHDAFDEPGRVLWRKVLNLSGVWHCRSYRRAGMSPERLCISAAQAGVNCKTYELAHHAGAAPCASTADPAGSCQAAPLLSGLAGGGRTWQLCAHAGQQAARIAAVAAAWEHVLLTHCLTIGCARGSARRTLGYPT